MNSDPGEFDSLRKLVSLKRYEQPPPGYFSRLPDKIMVRLECGEGEPGLWEKLVAVFAFRPAVAYGFSLAAFSALTLSVVYSVKTQPMESAQTPLRNGWRTVGAQDALAAQFNYNAAEPLHVANWLSNTNPNEAPSNLPSLFGSGTREHALPVHFLGSP